MLDDTKQLRRVHRDLTPSSGKSISVVTPTFNRPDELLELLDNLAGQDVLPLEVIVIDGSPGNETEIALQQRGRTTTDPFDLRYIRHASAGTAIQRNRGIDLARGDYIALIDDDVRLESDFLSKVVNVFEADATEEVGGIAGYRTNRHFTLDSRTRWKWYRRLGLLKSFEAGRYDFETGYPINNNMQPPFSGVRVVDFMTTACAVWRRSIFESGLRFDPFFKDYGVLEDAHFSLRAGKKWKLLQCGDARCIELHSPNGRIRRDKLGYKCVVNYYYVFGEIAGPLKLSRKFRFWRFQAFELCRIGLAAIRRRSSDDALDFIGRIKGIFAVIRGTADQ